MVELDQLKIELANTQEALAEAKASLDVVSKSRRIEELEREMEAPDFWNDADAAQKKTKLLKEFKDDVAAASDLTRQYEDIETLIEMGNEAEDPEIAEEAKNEFADLTDKIENIRMKKLLSEEYDANNAILRLNAGAGGTESCDWCSMLYRMYTRWAERKGFSVEELDFLEGEEAGIKSVTFQVNGTNAFGLLKSEKGIHR